MAKNPHDKSFVLFVKFVVLKPSHKLATNSHELFVGKMACFSIILHTFAYIRLKKP